MRNDKTEQPIPAEELDRIASDALYNCPKDAPAGSEAGRWKHGYIQGGKAEYARAHSLPPSPVGGDFEQWAKDYADKIFQDNPVSFRAHISAECYAAQMAAYDFIRLQKSAPPSPVGEAGLKWVKASERKPVVFAEEVIVRSLVTGRVRKTQNMGHNTGWDIGLDWHYKWENTEWLDESPNPSRAGETKDDFVKGYACALVCIIQGHGISTEVEDAYKAGLPTPVSNLKGRIDEFDYSILKKHFK